METTSKRPYLIRALYQWIIDNEMIPHIVVDTTRQGVIVPEEYIRDNKIILNLNPPAIIDLILADDDITFQARFSGVIHFLTVPVSSVMGIYAKETGAGMVFTSDEFKTGSDNPEPECDHVWSNPEVTSPPIVCTKCDVPKIRITGEKPGLSIVK